MTPRLKDGVRSDAVLVDSVPFDEVENAFGASADGLRGHVVALPDGEVGPSSAVGRNVMSDLAKAATDGEPLIKAILRRHSRPCVVTMGVFDGVHGGHRALLSGARRSADERGLPLVAVTFSPRPDQVLRPERALMDLCSLPTRVALLRDAGADDVVVLPFTRAVASISADRFVRLLVDDLGLRLLCVGNDFALGRARAGDVATLRTLGLKVVTIPFVLAPGGHKISSSILRFARAEARERISA